MISDPLSFKNYIATKVEARSIAESFVPTIVALITNHLCWEVTIVRCSITNTSRAKHKTLIHKTIITIKQFAPTKGTTIQRLSFPTLTAKGQVNNTIRFHTLEGVIFDQYTVDDLQKICYRTGCDVHANDKSIRGVIRISEQDCLVSKGC